MEFFKNKRITLLLIAIAFWVNNTTAFAQGVAPFKILDWHGSLLLNSMRENRDSNNDVKEENYRESLNLSNHGYIINPKLWAFEWDGKIAFTQENFIASNVKQISQGHLTNQSFGNAFLRESSHPFRLGYSHNANIINLSYNGRNEFDISSYRAALDILNIPLVSRFSAEIMDVKDRWQRGDYRNIRDQIRRNFTYSGTHEGSKYKTNVRAHIFGSDDRLSDDRSYSTYTLNYQTTRLFGDSLKNSWVSNVDALRRNGRKTYSSARLSQYLEGIFFRKIDSSMRYNFKTYNSLGVTSLENSASGNFTYPLTSYLNVGTGLGTAIGSSTSGQFNSGNISGNVAFNKKVPLGGMFQASYFRTLAHTSRDVDVTERNVVYEEHFFIGNAPIVLNERNIILSSIVIIDKDTKAIFEEGETRDYFIRDFGDRVEIHRNLLGRIEESTAVLIDYRFETLPSLKYNTGTQLISSTLSFSKLNLYMRHSMHAVDILEGALEARGATLGDINVLVAGLQSGARGKKAGLSLVGEFKSQEAADYAYDMINVRNTFFVKPSERITFTASIAYLNMVHRMKNYDLSDVSVTSDLKWQPTMDLFITSYFTLRNRDETDRSRELNYEYGVGIQRSWRIFRLKLEFDKRRWELAPQEIEEKRTTIELERIF